MCGCAHHWDLNEPCTCDCPSHEAIRNDLTNAQIIRLRTIVAELDDYPDELPLDEHIRNGL
jgi:hypothetical protein